MKPRVVPTKVHGLIDYIVSPALVAAPEVLRLNGARSSAVAPRAAGLAGALYSALTDYELGARRVLPMRTHLALDAVHGLSLALAPWVFGTARRGSRHWLPHALIGAGEIGLALTTKKEPPVTGLRGAVARLRRVGPTIASLPPAQRAAVAAIPLALIVVLAYAGRRQLYRAIAVAAEAVEEVADLVEDAADEVEDLAEDIADAARARAESSPDQAE